MTATSTKGGIMPRDEKPSDMTDDERALAGEKTIKYMFEECGLRFCVERDATRRHRWNGYVLWSNGSRGLVTAAQCSRTRAMYECNQYARKVTAP
jgi:hypothetical protein